MGLFYVYILTNKNQTVLYTGFTDEIYRRTIEHKQKLLKGFTYKFNVDKLLYFEIFKNKEEALHREKQIKKYRRAWKKNLINDKNPDWKDLFEDFIQI